MRRPPIIAILTAGAWALGLAAPASAQSPASQAAAPSSANAAGLRYLTWPGRAYRPAPAAPSVAGAEAAVAAPVMAASTPGRPPVIPHGGHPPRAAAPAPSAAPRQGLTPASAWIGSQAPAYAPQPAPTVEAPTAEPAPVFAPAPAPWSRSRAIAPAPPPAPTPASGTPTGYFAETAEAAPPSPPVAISRPAPRAEPTPAPTPTAPAPVAQAPLPETPSPAPAVDPMAPRRDAPIFRLQRPAPSAAHQAEAQPQAQPQPQAQAQAQAQAAPPPVVESPGGQGGARYYSVHRQAGRQPDATPLPAPVYLDALPVELSSTPASTDLAEPPAAPNLIRNANGRLQALPANEDPTLP